MYRLAVASRHVPVQMDRDKRSDKRYSPRVLKRVLLLEDDVAVRRAISRALRERGYRVVARATVDAAKAALQRGDINGQQFTVAILDVEVGERFGFEVAQVVPEGTEVVFFTGTKNRKLLSRARSFGRVVAKDDPQSLLTRLPLAS